MNKIYNSKLLTATLSLLLALILFLFVKTENYQDNPVSYFTNISETTTETLSNVPVYIEGDVQDYYVTGLPDSVSVELTGPRNIIEQTLESDDFRVVTEDLTDIGVGTHYIQLEVQNISENVEYQISPSSVNVTVHELQTQGFDIQVNLDEAKVADGYEITDVTVSPEQVQLMGSDQNISQVTDVSTSVSIPDNATESFTAENVTIITHDENGNLLDVSADPQQVNVTVTIEPIGKEVPINVIQQNPSPDITYSINTITPSTMQLQGSAEALESVNQLDVQLDLSDITSDTIQTVEIDTTQLPEGVSLSQETIEVDISATNNDELDVPSSSSASSSSSDPEASSAPSESSAESSEVENSDSSSEASSSESSSSVESNLESNENNESTNESSEPSPTNNSSTAVSSTSIESNVTDNESSQELSESIISWFTNQTTNRFTALTSL